MNLNIKTNYDLNLFYITDAASRWSEDVNYLFLEMLKEQCDFNQSIQKALNEFAEIRLENNLDWDANGELLPWAYNGFPKHSIFSKLITSIKTIENLKLSSGRPIKEFILEKIEKFETAKSQINNIYSSLKYKNYTTDEIISKLVLLNPQFSEIKNYIDCYLVLHTEKDFGAGGANGGIIFNEVRTINPDYFSDAKVIFHEYVHISTEIAKRVLNDPEYTNFFKKEFPGKKSTHAEVFEEMFVYSVCNGLIEKVDAKEKVEKYKKVKEQNVIEMIFIYIHIDEFGKLVVDFIEGRKNSEETYQEMVKKYVEWIKEFNLESN